MLGAHALPLVISVCSTPRRPTQALRVPVIHPESDQVPQRVQVNIPVISLVDHTILIILPCILSQETLQIPAIVIVAKD